MAVNRVGTAQVVQDNDTSVSQSITIHADSKIAVLLMTGEGTTNWLDPSDFTLGGTSFTNLVDTDGQSNNNQVWIGYIVNPSTGSQTFAGSLGSSPARGMSYIILGYDEVDTSSPITDSDFETTNNVDISGLTTGADDMTVGIAAKMDSAPTITDNSQTSISTGAYKGAGWGVAEKANSSAFQYSGAYYSTCAAAVLKYAASSIEQEGFRWRKDDGSESGASWHQNQDVDHTGFAKETNIRLRFLLNATGDPASTQYKLQYKKTADANYLDMPESDTPPDLVIEAGDTTEDDDANVTLTTHTINLPAYADGDLVIINIGFWQDNNQDTDMTFPSGPNGETLTVLETGYGGTGNVDAAMIALAWFIGDGADSGSAISVTSNNGSRTSSAMIVVPAGEFDPSKPLSTALDKDFSSSDSTTPNFGAFSANSDDAGGKLVVFLSVDQDEITTVPSGFTEWQQEDVGRASTWLGGRDSNVTASESISAAGSSWGGVNDAWAIYAYIVRPAPHHFHLSASSQFADGATTVQLAAPSGKTTGDFDAGQITEDDNPITAVDITDGDYTEIEFCFQATTDAEEVQYDFRIEGLNTYTVTPQLTISTGYTLTADPQTYALTGTAADTLYNRVLSAAAGAYTLTGTAANLLYNRLISAGAGAYALTGQDADFVRNYVLGAGAGAYTLTGQDAAVLYGRVMPAEAGAYALTGQAASTLYNRLVAAGSGSYALAGQDVDLLYNRLLSAGSGTYLLTGQDATLIYTPIGSYELIAESGSFILTGQDAGLLHNRVLAAAAGAINITGQDADPLYNRVFPVEAGSFTLTGQTASLLFNRLLSAGVGSYIITGKDASLIYSAAPESAILLDIDDGEIYLNLGGVITQI